MDESSNTEGMRKLTAHLDKGKRVKVPEKLSLLRAKLCQKAKQEKLVNARGESFQESRMREIRTSGSMRGEWVA